MQMQHRTDVIVRSCSSSDADYAAIAALNNASFSEFPTSVEEMRYEDERRLPHCKSARLVAELGGKLVGYAEYDQHPGTYDPRRFELELVVHPDHVGQGIGKQLYAALMEALRPFGPERVSAYAREDMPCRVRFLERRGFTSAYAFFSCELDLMTFDPAPFAHAVAAAEAQGFVLRSLAELQETDADVERKLYDLWLEIQEDVPIPPGEQRQHRPLEHWVARNLNHPATLPALYHIAIDGERYVGRSDLWRSPSPELLRTGLTGVRRQYRRRGLALALKARVLAAARALGYQRVLTENATGNQGMLAINAELGFRKKPAWRHYSAEWASASAM